MVDLRSSLFVEVHRRWLKRIGFAKAARKSVKQVSPTRSIGVMLSSYPASPGGPYRFSLELYAVWRKDNARNSTYHMYLPSYVTNCQFWTYSDETSFNSVVTEVNGLFESVAAPAIQKMHSSEGLHELFRTAPSHVPLFWFYQSYVALLNQLGKQSEAKTLLQKVIATAPHEGVKKQAQALLDQQETRSSNAEA